jgi:tellurite resistance protein
MIIFGTRGIRTLKETGDFYCPKCQNSRGYEWHRVNRWFTLYFLPVIPLGTIGEYIECSLCRATWEPEVRHLKEQIDRADRELLAEFQKGVREIMILMMLADGRIDSEEQEMIRSIYQRLSGEDYPLEQVHEDVRLLEAASTSIDECARRLSGVLNDEGRAMVFQAAILVAQASGGIVSEERKMLDRLASSLDLERNAVRAISERLEGAQVER